jgi:hypothetical protein
MATILAEPPSRPPLASWAAPDRTALLEVARDVAPRSLSAAWVAVVDVEAGTTVVAGEAAPTEGWLAAFVHGARSAAELVDDAHGVVTEGTRSDVIWAPMPEVHLALVAGRDEIAWRDRERDELRRAGRHRGPALASELPE